VDFDKFFDSENLTQTDIVVWVNLGNHHFPRAEDAPYTHLNEAKSGIQISPLNFNDEDMSSMFSNTLLVCHAVACAVVRRC
jgi:primary-amine oxidase